MWPVAVMAGMLLLLGAIGTAKAPTAFAAAGDLCLGTGPFPVVEPDDNDLILRDIDGKLHVGETYIFVIYVENDALASTGGVSVSIDDEEGDADLTSFIDDTDGVFGGYTTLSGVDVLPGLEPFTVAEINTGDPALLNNLADEFDAVFEDNFTGATDDCNEGDTDLAEGLIIVDVTCEDPGRFELTAYEAEGPDNAITGEFLCVAPPSTATLTATPTSVESSPALGNISHSLLVLTLTDADGNPAAPGSDVDWTTDRCRIQGRTEDQYEGTDGDDLDSAVDGTDAALFGAFISTNPSTASAIETAYASHAGLTGASTSVSFENDGNGPAPGGDRTIAVAILHCEGAAPGVATIAAEIERSGADLRATATVTVVGPPAFITMTAAPNKLICGEKATILVTVTDAINQKVSDHTLVELITNYGGVIGGTGSSLFFQNVNPLSSSTAETFGGVATAYLLTSTAHVGAYEVVAASGGTLLGGVFSTPVVTSQVTVTCSTAAPAVTAPSTGTGSISPPNTGDAGLAAGSSSNASLFVIAGAVAFALAGLASFRYARR
jgi:hypothetical protein